MFQYEKGTEIIYNSQNTYRKNHENKNVNDCNISKFSDWFNHIYVGTIQIGNISPYSTGLLLSLGVLAQFTLWAFLSLGVLAFWTISSLYVLNFLKYFLIYILRQNVFTHNFLCQSDKIFIKPL